MKRVTQVSLKSILSISLLAAVILLSSCKKTEEDQAINISKDVFTVADQKIIGQRIKEEIALNQADFKVLDQEVYPSFYNYINTLLQILVNTSGVEYREDFEWSVTVLEDDNLQTAFTAPGGQIFIYTGLLKLLSAENELMSIFAHEIAYADKEYAVYKLKDEYGGDLLGDIILGKMDTGIDQVARGLKTLSFELDQVAMADNYAVNLLCPFQYNAMGLKTIIEHPDHNSIQWLVTRPNYANRADIILEQAANCGDEDPTYAERYIYFKSQLPE